MALEKSIALLKGMKTNITWEVVDIQLLPYTTTGVHIVVLCNWFYMFLKCNFFCFKLIPKDKEKKNLKQVLVKNNFYIKKGYSVT